MLVSWYHLWLLPLNTFWMPLAVFMIGLYHEKRLPSARERGWDKRFGIHPDSYLRNVSMIKCGEYHLAQYIELFEWVSPDQIPLPKNNGEEWFKFSDLGNSYIAFTFVDVRVAYQHLKDVVIPAWGGRLVSEPMQFPLRGELCTSFFVVSPWGQWIELSDWSESTPLLILWSPLQRISMTLKLKPLRLVKSRQSTFILMLVLLSPAWILLLYGSDLDAFERNIATT